MTAVAIVERLETTAEQLVVLQALESAAKARKMKWRHYDDDQRAARQILAASEQEPPGLYVVDGETVVDAWPLPETADGFAVLGSAK
jgi:hypothetical protein